MVPYVIAEVKMRLRLRQRPIVSEDDEVSEQFIYDLIEGCLDPDEKILQFECAIMPEDLL